MEWCVGAKIGWRVELRPSKMRKWFVTVPESMLNLLGLVGLQSGSSVLMHQAEHLWLAIHPIRLNSSKYGTIAVYIAAMASDTVCFIGDFMSLRSPMWFMYGHLLGTCPALHVCTFTLFIDYQAPLSAHRVPW